MHTLKAIAVLMHYPDEDLQRHGGELVELVSGESRLSPGLRQAVAAFIRGLQETDLMDLQAAYVGMFDRSRSLSLHLFEHVHGESRDRGQAMVDMLDIYRKQGFEVTANELPDYVPLFLEFCSRLPEQEARDWLQQTAHLFQEMHVRLEQRESGYALLFKALLELGQVVEADAELRRQLGEEAPDDTAEALDKAWEEEQVMFGPTPGSDGCGGAKTHTGQAVPVDVSQLRRSQG